ncbi:hypothetical protein [Streptomyces sp. NPDC057460]|uniref:hypothetical protein n=1 Tax=Streptomyces sp. NPDC057460 TaxID=3346141 RepID=UPI00369DEDF4
MFEEKLEALSQVMAEHLAMPFPPGFRGLDIKDQAPGGFTAISAIADRCESPISLGADQEIAWTRYHLPACGSGGGDRDDLATVQVEEEGPPDPASRVGEAGSNPVA